MKTLARILIPVLFLLLFITVIPLAHAQDIQYQVELLNKTQIGDGIEISTNKINFTVKNNEGSPLSSYQVLLPVIVDDQSSVFTVATPPTGADGVSSIVFQNVTRADNKIVFADLSAFTLQQAVQPLGCCQIEYVGGTIYPIPIEQYGPIAICAQSLNQADGISCTGLMMHGGTKSNGAWTNLSQPCTTVNSATVKPLLCGSGNPGPVTIGVGIGTTNGITNRIFQDFFDCWKKQSSNGTRPWAVILPVVDCPGGEISSCSKVIEAVRVNIMWVKYRDATQPYYPTTMAAVPELYGPWTSPDPGSEEVSWQSFASHFRLRTMDNVPAPLEKRTIYFLPECRPYAPPPITLYDYSCFTGYAADSMTDCAILDSVYKREGIGNTFWNDNYICNQETLLCE